MPATKTRTFRFNELELSRIRRLAEHLKASEREAISLAILLLSERLGLTRSAAIELAEDIAREHGDDAAIVATIKHDAETGYFAEVTVAGRLHPDLVARATPYITEIAGQAQLQGITVHLHDQARDAHYLLGTVMNGDELAVTARELPALLVERSRGRSDREVRESFAMDQKLRALLRGAPTDEEEEDEE